ncbi:hypothetical protein [Chryseobacterium luquanense]|uniref:DUF4468 domain-containing protein n=1 Tax=Chryseobacterium luquanense TaxID=2983766 RepID=A0ABT3Y8G9_9FLAO|nr:hypothetical protein [Chryseobacterium luquanense]MCX8534457.1 hypothetical protein [Chryseobacterium luquanense]
MKKIFLFLFVAVSTTILAQDKLTIESGNLSFLKGQTEVNVERNYGSPLFQAENFTETEYLDRRHKETVAKKSEVAWKTWIDTWEQHVETIWTEKFIEGLNKSKKIKFAQNVETKYTLIIHPKWMYAGWQGFVTQPGKLSAEITIVETANPSNVLATLKGDKIEGTGSKVDYGMEYGRISAAYEKTGKEFGKELKKALK